MTGLFCVFSSWTGWGSGLHAATVLGQTRGEYQGLSKTLTLFLVLSRFRMFFIPNQNLPSIKSQTLIFLQSKFCKNMEKARELWNDVMKAGFGNQAQKWLDYFQLERFVLRTNCSVEFYTKKFADVTHVNPFVLLHVTGRLVITSTAARSSRGRSTRSADWPESICDTYIKFEREEGTLEQYDVAVTRVEAQMKRIKERRAKVRTLNPSVNSLFFVSHVEEISIIKN